MNTSDIPEVASQDVEISNSETATESTPEIPSQDTVTCNTVANAGNTPVVPGQDTVISTSETNAGNTPVVPGQDTVTSTSETNAGNTPVVHGQDTVTYTSKTNAGNPTGNAKQMNTFENKIKDEAAGESGLCVIGKELNKDQNRKEVQPENSVTRDEVAVKSDIKKLGDNQTDDRESETRVSMSFNDIIYGHCEISQLPPLPKKVVRVFISSTFTDTKEERNALMQKVYPKLSDYCRDRHGLQFQVMDMRWGVPEQASDNHSTTDLCLQEIRKCQQLSVGPNFVALVGNKYGYRPIPSEITDTTFDELAKSCQYLGETMIHKWRTVEEWYTKDENAIPPEYLLQPISSKIPHYNDTENVDLKKKAQGEWHEINMTLTQTLREAAALAYEKGGISEEEKDKFFTSVTEKEITEGFFNSEHNPSETSYCVIRKIEDIEQQRSHPKIYRFTDVTSESAIDKEAQELLRKMEGTKIQSKLPQSNLLKIDIEWKISGANISVVNVEDVKAEHVISSSNDEVKSKHAEYLDKVCSNFLANIRKLIDDGIEKQSTTYNPQVQEILQHWHLARTRCDIFEGRGDELKRIHQLLSLTSLKTPIIIHGCSGCGKTSVMAKVVECLSSGKWLIRDKAVFLIPRFLGTTPKTSNLHQLLVSICQQLSLILQITWKEPENFKELVESFHTLLNAVNSDKTIVILLDSIDQLMPTYNAFKIKWLPEVLPENVKVIVSTIDEGYPIIKALKERYGSEHAIALNALGEKLGLDIIKKWLTSDRRKLTEQQEQITREVLTKCSLPLYARIVYDQIRRWKSHVIPSAMDLESTVQGAINKLFSSVEEKFGDIVVKHMISYFTAARQGISEAELEHMLSLDDTLLNHIFQLWNPPIRRVPPLLWTRIRTELHSYIVERSSDDTLVLNWYHRQFIETAKKRYLSDESFVRYIHDHMVQYFNGKWGGNKMKPFQYTEAQRKRFDLDTSKDAKDRKVPLQPYTFGDTPGVTEIRFNKRKLSELPFHLIKSKDYRSLKLNVFLNYEWLHAKLMSSSIQQLLEEFEIFMQADKQLKTDNDMILMYTNLQLLRPFVYTFPQSLAFELTGRLAEFIDQSEFVANLIKGCDSGAVKHCPILPVITCFESAKKGFSHHIQFRTTDTWVEGGAICASKDFKTLYILDYTVNGMPMFHIYDLLTGEKVTELDIVKPYEGTTDMYIKLHLSRTQKEILAFYRQKSEGQTEKKFRDKYALIDVINIETGKVMKTIEGIMPRQQFRNALMYLTENYLCVDFMEKVPVVGLWSDFRKDLNKPTFLSENEKLFIVCGRDNTALKQFSNKSLIGEFDVTNRQAAVGGSQDFSVVIMVETGTHRIRLYDLTKFFHHSSDANDTETQSSIIKNKAVFDLTDAKTLKIISDTLVTAGDNVEESGKRKYEICLSPKKDYFIVTYQGQKWLSYMYSINLASWSVTCNGIICANMPSSQKYPVFTYDGTKVVYALANEVVVVSSRTSQMIQKFDLSQSVKDFVLSGSSDRIAVMLNKSVLTLKINFEDSEMEGSLQRNKSNPLQTEANTSNVLIQRTVSDTFTQPEIVIAQKDGRIVLEEIKDLHSYADTDRIASARSKKKRALVSYVTPNGLRTIQFHRKVQVVDTKLNEIRYTPKKGDTIARTVNKNGDLVNENLPIPGLSQMEWNLPVDFSMDPGDRIVGETGGKVKFRVNQEPSGQLRIQNIPSVLTVYSVDELKLTQLSSIIIHDENVVTVGNEILVTTRGTSNGYFVNIYNLKDGKLMATHKLDQSCAGARLSKDGVQLFVLDSSLMVYLYISPAYNSLERKVTPVSTNSGKFTVRDLLCFEEDRNALLVFYTPQTSDMAVHSKYCHVDLLTKQFGEPISVNSAFDDVSLCGKLAIDSKLQVYDLPKGELRCQVAYQAVAGEGFGIATDVQLTARFIDDKHLVFLDRRDETLHLASLETRQVIASAFYHVPEFNHTSQLYPLQKGILLMKTDTQILCFVLVKHLNDDERNEETYRSEKGRALKLVSHWCEDKGFQKNDKSMYIQRDLLKQNLLDALPAIETPIEREFKKQNPERPQVLVISSSVLPRYFVPSLFSKFLKTEQISVTSSDVALSRLASVDKKYDVILLQLITDDVTLFTADQCVTKVSKVIDVAKEKSRMVVLSLAPCRADGQDVNMKTQQVNAALEQQYKSNTVAAVHLCRNDNLSENGKPIMKYFQDGVTLSPAGTKQITINYKDVMLPLLGEHYSVGQKKKPKLQSSGNRVM